MTLYELVDLVKCNNMWPMSLGVYQLDAQLRRTVSHGGLQETWDTGVVRLRIYRKHRHP